MNEPLAFAGDNRTLRLNGDKLVALRRGRGLSREQLADASTGVHRLSIATIKRAEHGNPVYLETARRLAGLLGVPIQSLLDTHEAVEQERASRATLAPLGNRPVGVVVLPFRAAGDDADTRLLADGMVEDLTTRLGNWWFPVICRASTFDYHGAADRSEAARHFHVGYFVEGSVQRRGDRVRVQSRLVATESGEQLWAAEFNRAHSKLFALQDELTCGIIDGVNQKLLQLEARRIQWCDPGSLQAWELAVRGSQLFYRRTASDNQAARDLLARAVREDQTLAWAYFLLAMTYQQDIINQWSAEPQGCLSALAEVAAQFERWHYGDARTDVILAYSMIYQGKREAAAERLQRAINSAPNLNFAYSLFGQTMAMANDPDPAIEQFELAMRLSPRDSDLWSVQTSIALAHFVAERYDLTLKWAEQAVQLRPDIAFTFGTVAAASALAGDIARAKVALTRMLELHPGISARGFETIVAATRPEIARRYMGGLRLAGLAL